MQRIVNAQGLNMSKPAARPINWPTWPRSKSGWMMKTGR
ncbi:hypothetical protein PS704_02529 [Pseudomonas fluorescens]|jgi:hypothetical protein|uniref:Uncharacterized protein n=1 Tax=Pseudomonas fluorescens TaxID=294 RepID=A0A5E7C3X9_PSEFL|nr:hypothetical protein PS704_02529 [Pseudomonas fluorescens]